MKCNIDNNGVVQAFQRFDPIGREKEDYLFINPLSLDHADQNILYLPAGNQFYRQSDLASIPLNGDWEATSAGWTKFPDTISNEEAFTAIGVSKSGPAHRVYLGTSDNQIFRIDNAHTGAPSMTKLTSPLPDPTGNTTFPYVSCIAVDPENGDKAVLVFSNYAVYSIWSTEDGGQTWAKVGGNLENNISGTGNAPSIRWMNILTGPGGARQYFAGTSVGLYSTTELKLHATGLPGTAWTPEGTNIIGNVPVPYVESRPADGLVVAATHGHGIFSANVLPPSSTQLPNLNLDAQIFPNPTSDFLRMHIETAGVQCRFYDGRGRMVRQLPLVTGQNIIDLRDWQSGVYYYEISSGAARKTGKVVKL